MVRVSFDGANKRKDIYSKEVLPITYIKFFK